ncbi:MAG: hypothetical protein FWE69_02975 [Clostridiales bacterium]|nr:hypothetical protein [Clostridiales bacterium]
MLFKKQTEEPLPPFETQEAEQNVPAENPFSEIGVKLVQMEQEGRLPEGFDLETACQDKAFAELVLEMEPEAAIRVWAAEKKAENAMQEALDMVQKRLTTRNALPKQTRTTGAVSAEPDYNSMSPEAFRTLENQLRAAARNGKKMKI